MRLRSICISVAVLVLLTTSQIRAQAPDRDPAQPDGGDPTTKDSAGGFASRKVVGPGLHSNAFYGPVVDRPRAGDPAPDLLFTKVLRSPGSLADPAPWTSADFSGQVTVIAFFPDTSDNLQAVTRWNAVVKQFSNKPVQFVWITGEKEASLVPWLVDHPVDGWLLLDAEGATGRAYGLETPEAVIVAPDRNIVGFDRGFVPTKELVNAALEGRTRTEPVKPEPAAKEASLSSRMVLLDAEPQRVPGIDEYKPKFSPSYEVHITPSEESGSFSASGGDYWSLGGVSLKRVIAETYDMVMQLNRIDFADASTAEKRYNVALVLPRGESHDAMMRRIREAIEEKFNLTITAETRATEVYVVSAPKGPGPSLHPIKPPSGGSGAESRMTFAWMSKDGSPPTAKDMQKILENGQASSPVNVKSVSIQGGTIADFCRELETLLDRPVVDETNLTGTYDFEVNSGDHTQGDFFPALADQLGLVVEPGIRSLNIVVVR